MIRDEKGNGVVVLNPEESFVAKKEDYIPSFEEALEELKKEEYDYIKPKHYEVFPGMKDTFEIHRAYLTREEYIGWIKGTILKYKLRMGEKPGESYERDMKKINVYREELKNYLNLKRDE